MPPAEELLELPRAGAGARMWWRFERDLDAWLRTPQGAFATWLARDGRCALGAEAANDDLGVVGHEP